MTARMADEPVLVKIFSFLKDVRSRLACTALTESVVQLKNTHIFPGKKKILRDLRIHETELQHLQSWLDANLFCLPDMERPEDKMALEVRRRLSHLSQASAAARSPFLSTTPVQRQDLLQASKAGSLQNHPH